MKPSRLPGGKLQGRDAHVELAGPGHVNLPHWRSLHEQHRLPSSLQQRNSWLEPFCGTRKVSIFEYIEIYSLALIDLKTKP